MLIASAVLALSASGAAPPGVIFVDGSAKGANDGSCWKDAYRLLQEAIASASFGDELWVAHGTYYPDEWNGVDTNDRESSFQILDGVKIYGGFTGNEASIDDRNDPDAITILSGDLMQDDAANFANVEDNSLHVVRMNSVGLSTVLNRLSISGGNASGPGLDGLGGGALLIDASPWIVRCTFEGNLADYGGGACSVVGAPLIEDSEIRDNLAGIWGGGWSSHGSRLAVYGCAVRGNSAPDGGGLNAASGVLSVADCLFSENNAEETGGAVCSSLSAVAQIEACDFYQNEAARGAGVCVDEATAGIQNSVFRSNMAGGASSVTLAGSEVTIVGCQFEQNFGGVVGDSGSGDSRLVVRDSAFVGNLGGTGAAIFIGRSVGNVDGCTFERNGSFGFGGAIYHTSDFFSVQRSVFRQNWCWNQGGAIYTRGDIRLVSNEFVYNIAALDDGGAVYHSTARFSKFASCTFVGNETMNGLGGGVFVRVDIPVSNCIFWGNRDRLGEGETSQLFASGAFATPHACCIQGLSAFFGNGNTGADPRFIDAAGPDTIVGTADDDLRLSIDSPCIDAGDNLRAPRDYLDSDRDGDSKEPLPFDLVGLSRLADVPAIPDSGVPGSVDLPIIDMGAHEAQDCNRNGILDAVELLHDWSEDCNGNGIPDGCETDCNGNGVPDDCDLASGFSLDQLPRNGVPDECDEFPLTKPWK